MADRGKRPLVYGTRTAVEQGRRLLPGSCLEVEVADAIVRGDVTAGQGGGYVFVRDAVAHVTRTPPRVRHGGARAWLVDGVERRRP